MDTLNNSILDIAKKELINRKLISIDEVKQIIILTKNILKTSNIHYYDIFNEVLKDLNNDIHNSLQLNEYIFSFSHELTPLTYPLKYNKNFELLSGILEFCKNYTHYLFSDELLDDLDNEKISINRVLFKGFDSYLNYIKIFYFTTLHLILKDKLSRFFYDNNILNISLSPNIQTTLLPQNLDHNKIKFKLKKWKYFYHDKFSKAQGELLYPTNGYAFGGSNEDRRFASKKFRAEDCLTSILKWIDAEKDFTQNKLTEFSTLDIEKFYDSYNGQEKSQFHGILSNYITPIHNFDNVRAGDIFAYREYDLQNDPTKTNHKYSLCGHIGVISKMIDNYSFEHISYSRRIPEVEGLVFSLENTKMHPHKKYMFFKTL
jgi:hypothetical protein